MNYNLELEEVTKEIKKNKAKKVCIQLPDGLKPNAVEMAKELKEKTGSEIIIWAGDCFGACDTPIGLKDLGIDMLIQFGHSAWPFYE
jgi:2-(3-amino-3-carboxypropyl)histidine synthase